MRFRRQNPDKLGDFWRRCRIFLTRKSGNIGPKVPFGRCGIRTGVREALPVAGVESGQSVTVVNKKKSSNSLEWFGVVYYRVFFPHTATRKAANHRSHSIRIQLFPGCLQSPGLWYHSEQRAGIFCGPTRASRT